MHYSYQMVITNNRNTLEQGLGRLIMESTSRRSSILLVLLMVLMVFSHSAGATITPDINYSVMDSALIESINSEDNINHPVIIQFTLAMTPQIRAFLIKIDVFFEDESQLLNGGLANMNVNQIAHLSNHPNIRFLNLTVHLRHSTLMSLSGHLIIS